MLRYHPVAAAVIGFHWSFALAELCGEGFEPDVCVTAKGPCGPLPSGASHLTLLGYSADGLCLVGDLDPSTLSSGICNATKLTRSDGCTPAVSIVKPLECYVLTGCAVAVHVVLLILVLRGPEDQQNRKLQSGAFWWSHFWAGLVSNMIAIWETTQGEFSGNEIMVVKLVSFLFGGLCVSLIYDVPLHFLRQRWPKRWFLASWMAGLVFICVGLRGAYSAGMVVAGILGHWTVNGLLMLVLDYLGQVALRAFGVWRGGEQPQPYQLLVVELTEQAPALQTEAASGTALVLAQTPGPGEEKKNDA
ncbi:unnamed protein product [Symbiodinium natans]|uniref:Uncharacterized protein n=1 Tax=Symbiodinium natans TaxID=878477 RepID=A0A812TKE6_9DINO|nr:unnamed protein product [Symbiodinium natans]